jgi:integrase
MKAATETFPIAKTSAGITVRIYDTSTKKRPGFTLAYYDNGQRKREQFGALDSAKKKAASVLDALTRGQTRVLKLTNRDADMHQRAVHYLKPTGVPLDIAAKHFAEAVKLLDGEDFVTEAARRYAKQKLAKLKTIPVPELVDAFIDSKKTGKKKLSADYLDGLSGKLKEFKVRFQMPVASLTAEDLQDFFDTLDCAPRTHDNKLTTIRTLTRWAKKKRYLPKTWDLLDDIEKLDTNSEDVQIYSTEEAAKLLKHAHKAIRHCIAIGCFAGLRPTELRRLDWSEVDARKDGFITVRTGKAKTKTRRVVPIQPNLLKWLKPVAKKSGPVWPHCKDYFYETLNDSATAAKVGLKYDAFRHSFASYRLAATRNAYQTALECGHDVRTVFAHYAELVKPEQAAKYFSVSP